jgi:2,3-bisphosphoglycerate-dependent phosphoglycerate mutase
MATPDLPMQRSWRLNERHFGALQGMGRLEAVRAYGLLRVLRLQGSYTEVPPPLEVEDRRSACQDPLFAGLTDKEIPKSESLADTYARVIPYWQESIVPHLKAGRSVLIVGHKNSLRVLAQRIESLADEAVPKLRLMTGAPLIYHFDDELNLLGHGFLEPQPRFSRWSGLSPA